MRLLVFGRSGQLARALAAAAPGAVCLGRAEADLAVPGAAAAALAAHAPGAVINAAAFTDVDGAETAEAAARRINAAAAGEIAAACAARALPLVHVSTDYVFGAGAGSGPWRPGDAPAPLNAYGRGKAEGEAAVRAAGGVHAILRTAWVFAPGARNFVTAILAAGAARAEIDVVADQVGGPTPAGALARACLAAARGLAADPGLSGTYHFSGAPELGRADFARVILERAGLACRVRDVAAADRPAAAARPADSRLDCRSFVAAFGGARPDWRPALDAVIAGARAA